MPNSNIQPDMTYKLSSFFLSQSGTGWKCREVRGGHWELGPSWAFSDDGIGDASAHGGHHCFIINIIIIILERVKLDKKKEKWEKTHPKYASLPPNYSQDMNEKKKKIKALPSHGLSMVAVTWKGPLLPLELIRRPELGEKEGGRNKTFALSQPPRSHLTFYNPFNSPGRAKEKTEGGEGRKRRPRD